MPKHCTKEVKEVITNVRNFFQQEKDEGEPINLTAVVARTAKAVGYSERTIKNISKECKDGVLQEPAERTGRKRIDCDEFLQGVIRRMIYNFYMEKKFPTIKELFFKITTEVADIPTFSERTLLRWLRNLNFSYKKLNNKPILMEHPKMSSQRSDFLLNIEKYRNRGWKIYYTDETWCGANHSKKFGWVEKVSPESADTFNHYRGGVQEINGYRGGIVRPSGSGQRVIILHIGCEEGFLEGCLKCFIGEKKKAKTDYHHEMNRQHYEEWFRHVLSVIPANSVIVIDQATYHTMLDPEFRNPTIAWKKNDIIAWLLKKKVPLPDGTDNFSNLTKPQLLQLSKPYFNKKVFLLESIIQQLRGDEVKLLWLPVAHCEFNAIELVWAYLKNQVAKRNDTFKIKDVLNLCIETMNTIPANLWENCVRHSKNIEKKYREKEHIVDEVIEPIIINIDDNESSDDNLSSDDDFSEDEFRYGGDIDDTNTCSIEDASSAGPSNRTRSGNRLTNLFTTGDRLLHSLTDQVRLRIPSEPTQTTVTTRDYVEKK